MDDNDPWSDPWEMPADEPEEEEEPVAKSVGYANLSRTDSSFFIKDSDILPSPPKIFAQTMPCSMIPPPISTKTSPHLSPRVNSPTRIPRLASPTRESRQPSPSPTRNSRTSSPMRFSHQSSPSDSRPNSPSRPNKSKTQPSPGSSMTPLRRLSLTEAARPRNSGKSNSRFLLPDPESASYSGSTWMFKSKTPRAPKARPPSVGQSRVATKHDQTAALMGLLSASGLTMEMLMAMDEETQRETLIAAATIRNSSRLTDNERLQLRNGQAMAEEDASNRVRFSLPISPVKEREETKEELGRPKIPSEFRENMSKLQKKSTEHLEKDMAFESEADFVKPVPRVKSVKKVSSIRLEQSPIKLERLSSMKLDHPVRVERMTSVRFEQSPVKSDTVKRAQHESAHVPTKAHVPIQARVHVPAPVQEEIVDPRKAMMNMLAKRGGGAGGGGGGSVNPVAVAVAPIGISEPTPDPRKAMMAMLAKKGGGGGGGGGDASSVDVSAKPPADPRNAMMAMLAKRGGGGGEGGAAESSPETKTSSSGSSRGGGSGSGSGGVSGSGSGSGGVSGSGGGGGGDVTVQLKDCRKFGKYFKMLKVRAVNYYYYYYFYCLYDVELGLIL